MSLPRARGPRRDPRGLTLNLLARPESSEDFFELNLVEDF